MKKPDFAPAPGFALRCTLAESQKALRRAIWSRDGRLLAVPGEEPLVRIWDVPGERIHRTLRLDGPALTTAFSPDGSWLAVGNLSPYIDIWHLETGVRRPCRFPIGDNRYAASVAISPDGKVLAAGSNTGRILLWDLKSEEQRYKLPGHAGAVQALAFRPGTSMFVSASQDNNLAIWNTNSEDNLGWLRGHVGSVYAAAWSPDGGLLASGAADCTVRLWSPDARIEIRPLFGHTGPVVSVSFSCDGRLLASKALDGTARLWRCDTWQEAARLPASTNDRNLFSTVAFHPHVPCLVISDKEDTALRMWDLDIDRLLAEAEALVPPPAAGKEAERAGQERRKRDKVFISYSHKDREWLDRLRTMLAPLIRNGSISPLDDTTIRAGAKWKEEIEAALASARVAVLLVSDDFLASEFIAQEELPPLLAAATQDGVKILWVYVSTCYYEATPIQHYQAAYSIDRTLAEMSEAEWKRALKAICKSIKEAAALEGRGHLP